MRRGCNACTVGPAVSLLRHSGETNSGNSGSTAPTIARYATRWGAKAEPPVYLFPGGFAVNAQQLREVCVMSRRNWSLMKQRSLMRQRGVEDVKGGTPPIVTPTVNKQPYRRPTKAELREQSEAAVLAWRAGRTSKNK